MRRSYTQRRGKGREKDTKTHQIRRVGLDPDTLELLAEAWEDFGKVMAQLGAKAGPSAFIFSYQPDHSKPYNPDAITRTATADCAPGWGLTATFTRGGTTPRLS